jgi:hypothetical protein
LKASPPSGPQSPPKVITPELFGRLSTFVLSNLDGFGTGHYVAAVAFWKDHASKPEVFKAYSFNVRDTDFQLFSQMLEHDRTGEGSLYPSTLPPSFSVQLDPIVEQTIIAQLRAEFGSSP